MNKEIIEALQKNEKPFGLMSDELREAFRDIYTPLNLDIYLSNGWMICGSSDWNDESVYRLRNDYKPESDIVECEIVDGEYIELHKNGAYERRKPLSKAFNDIRFMGFKYADGIIRPTPTYFGGKFSNTYSQIAADDFKAGNYTILHVTHVIFKGK